MQIRNFDKIRVNDIDNILDIQSVVHSDYGVMITAYDFASKVVEVRRKDNQTAMFAFKFSDLEMPEYWKDAEIIFTTRKE